MSVQQAAIPLEVQGQVDADRNEVEAVYGQDRGQPSVSPRKVQANRENALKSTGPRTVEGKYMSSQNAVQHGLLATKHLVLPVEQQAELDSLCDHLMFELAPTNEVELLLADRIVSAAWRLRRVYRIESELLSRHVYEEKAHRARRRARRCESEPVRQVLAQLAPPPDSPDYVTAAAEMEQAEELLHGDDTLLGMAFDSDVRRTGTIEKLARYEAHLERQMYRALHELERLKRMKCGVPTPAPVPVDVSVT